MSLQYGIKEVLNLSAMDFATGNPLYYIDYAEASSNEVSGERTFITSGQGNQRWMAFDHSKTSTLKLTVPIVDLNLLAQLMGDTVATGAQNVVKREVVTVSGAAATLSQTPLAGTTPTLFFLNGTRDNGTALSKVASAPAAGQYSITGTALTFNATDNGKQVVVWYTYATPVSTTKFTLKSNKFASAVKLVGNGLARDAVTDVDVATVITFFKAKPQTNYTVTMSSTDVTKLEITYDLFAVPSGSDFAYADYVFLT